MFLETAFHRSTFVAHIQLAEAKAYNSGDDIDVHNYCSFFEGFLVVGATCIGVMSRLRLDFCRIEVSMVEVDGLQVSNPRLKLNLAVLVSPKVAKLAVNGSTVTTIIVSLSSGL